MVSSTRSDPRSTVSRDAGRPARCLRVARKSRASRRAVGRRRPRGRRRRWAPARRGGPVGHHGGDAGRPLGQRLERDADHPGAVAIGGARLEPRERRVDPRPGDAEADPGLPALPGRVPERRKREDAAVEVHERAAGVPSVMPASVWMSPRQAASRRPRRDGCARASRRWSAGRSGGPSPNGLPTLTSMRPTRTASAGAASRTGASFPARRLGLQAHDAEPLVVRDDPGGDADVPSG